MAKSNNSLSGISIGLGFVGVGLIFGYWFSDLYGSATPYVAATLIIFGLVGFLVELQKKLTSKNFRFDNGGLGLILLAPSLFFSYLIYENWVGPTRSILISLLALLMLMGLMAVLDLFVSIFEELVKSKDIKGKVIGLLQFLAVCATAFAAIFAAVNNIVSGG